MPCETMAMMASAGLRPRPAAQWIRMRPCHGHQEGEECLDVGEAWYDQGPACVGYPGARGLPPGLWAETTASGPQRKIAPGTVSREATAVRIVLLEKGGAGGDACPPRGGRERLHYRSPPGGCRFLQRTTPAPSVRGAALVQPGEERGLGALRRNALRAQPGERQLGDAAEGEWRVEGGPALAGRGLAGDPADAQHRIDEGGVRVSRELSPLPVLRLRRAASRRSRAARACGVSVGSGGPSSSSGSSSKHEIGSGHVVASASKRMCMACPLDDMLPGTGARHKLQTLHRR